MEIQELLTNPQFVYQPIDNLISVSHSRTLTGLRLLENMSTHLSPSSEELQEIQFLGTVRSIEQSKNEFKNWLLIKGFEEIHSAIRNSLERFYVYIITLKKLKNDNLPKNSLSEFYKQILIDTSRFNYPTLVNKISNEIKEDLLYESNLASFNNARNCLVHDYGKVTQGRCNSLDKKELHITGNRFLFFYQRENEETIYPMEFGKISPKNASLKVKGEEFTLKFRIGETINLNYLNYLHILNTCIFYKADLQEKIKKYYS